MDERRKRRRQLAKKDKKSGRQRDSDTSDSTLVGFFAQRDLQLICDGDACVVAGSRQQMAAIIGFHGLNLQDYRVRKTTAAEVIHGLQLGGAYCFDQQAYDRLLPAAQAAGLPFHREDIGNADATFGGVPLLRLQLTPPMFADDEGMHFIGPGAPPDEKTLGRMSQKYQESIRNSPLWDEMVREFGSEQAERMLKEFRAELR